MDLGQNIKKRRLELSMSQGDLAAATGYKSRSAITKIESGANEVPIGKLLAFARALDTTVEQLLAEVDVLGTVHGGRAPGISSSVDGHRTVALVLAGGKSTRNQQNIPNQFINALGKPVIIYSLEAYQAHPMVDDIYVACLKGWEDIVQAYARQYSIDKLRDIVPAGKTGLHSIRNGVDRLIERGHGDFDIVVIQETTRPFVTEETISKLLKATAESGSSVICEPLNDHLAFRRDSSGTMDYMERDSIYSMQSPDAHCLGTLVDMFDKAEDEGVSLDQNCCGMLLYELGMPLNFVEGNHNNIKLVRQEDVAVFTTLLRLHNYD